MEDILVPILIVGILFLGLPWIIFHYVTKWKSSATLTGEDEKLLDELHDMARRLDDRMCTIERIMTAENPTWRQSCLPETSSPLSLDFDEPAPTRRRSRARRGEEA
jgi:phage shock protein B